MESLPEVESAAAFEVECLFYRSFAAHWIKWKQVCYQTKKPARRLASKTGKA